MGPAWAGQTPGSLDPGAPGAGLGMPSPRGPPLGAQTLSWCVPCTTTRVTCERGAGGGAGTHGTRPLERLFLFLNTFGLKGKGHGSLQLPFSL